MSCARQFSRNFQKKNLEKTKKQKKKTKKTIFQRYWKAEKCKTKKTSRKPKKQKKKTKSWGGGGQTRVSKYFFFGFFLFSRGFFGFALFCFPRPLDFFFLICFGFLVFSRFLYFFQGALPKDSQNVILDLFK